MKVKKESKIAQSCLTLSDPMDCSLPGSSAHGIFQARVLEWGVMEGLYIHIKLNHIVIQQKLTHFKAILLHLKYNKIFKNHVP